ncbi:hypothetical protein ACFW9D_30800 [Streptomyces sp. NPDC059524]|uniref:hypothetical protein n=1 Tax=Streptomyces sp. NPDC059524 TaxID=3346856 RepID=UPI00369E2C60
MVTLSALPGLQGSAEAAPKPKPVPGKKKQELCEDKFDLKGVPPRNRPLDGQDTVRDLNEWDDYFYDNQRQAMDGVILPGDSDDDPDRKAILKATGSNPKKYKEGDPRKVWASYNRYLKKNNGVNKFGSFDTWLNEAYIELAARRTKGEAFHKKVVKDLGLTGPDWYCEEDVEYTDAEGKKRFRRYDAVNHKTGEHVEVKSGPNHKEGQTPKDRAVLRENPKARLIGVFGEGKSTGATNTYKGLEQEFGKDAQGRNRVVTREHISDGKPRYKPGPHSRYNTYMTPAEGQNQGSRGAGNQAVNNSAPSLKEAKAQAERARALNGGDQRPRGPGGIDFSTLDLRYVGKPVKGQGLDYSFSAKKTDEDSNPGWGGKAKAQMISDAFFTWLALDPSKFWVNLNPDQPDRIMDARFGRTDAGRVLLEADLEMKRDYADALNPNKRDEADRFWRSMPKNKDGVPCFFQVRNWIEPGTAQVREQDGGIYILDTPLKVKSEYMKMTSVPPGSFNCDFNEAQKRWAERQVNRLIIPEVEKRVNNDPEYADLRRVYTARVAAEWIRLQDAKSRTDYHSIIDSGDVSRWPLRGANKDWTRETTYRAYVKSYREGEEKWQHDAGGGPYTYSVGGVDFSKQPKRNVTGLRFRTEHRYKPRQTRNSLQTVARDPQDKDLLLLGGNTAAKSTGGGDGGGTDPTPTPTTAPTDHSPAPAPSDPSASTPPAADPTRAPQDPDGDLADTGSDTPIALIATLAAVLAAAGAALTWWYRRKGTQS